MSLSPEKEAAREALLQRQRDAKAARIAASQAAAGAPAEETTEDQSVESEAAHSFFDSAEYVDSDEDSQE